MTDTYLFKATLATVLPTLCPEHDYAMYVGIDADDRIFGDHAQQHVALELTRDHPNVRLSFVVLQDCRKGHVTRMWNQVCAKAVQDGAVYFYQCGDDIVFATKGWVNDCIRALELHGGFGITGPLNNNPDQLLTQAFVSIRHVQALGYFFPEEIVNWCCDDWYNYLYAPNMRIPLKQHYCKNTGGEPRYDINNEQDFNKKCDYLRKLACLRKQALCLARRDRLKIDALKQRLTR